MNINFDKVLTKDFVLSRVGEEEIFSRFGVPVQDGVFRSPLRGDRHPTCNFYRRRNGRLYLRDHAGYFWGDCFDLVMKTQNVSFGKALSIVSKEFNLTDDVVIYERKPAPKIQLSAPEFCDIRVKRRDWNVWDKSFWGRWDFKKETLDFFHISPIKRVWINENPVYSYQKGGEEAYVYHFGQYDYKVYFPYKDKIRFLHNNSMVLQGWLQLPPSGDYVLLTKSMKDIAKAYEFGIPACGPMSETILPSLAHMEELSERFGRIIVLYDNDWPGKRSAMKLHQKYGERFKLEFLLFPYGMPKDFTDYYEKKGKESTTSLIEHVKTELEL